MLMEKYEIKFEEVLKNFILGIAPLEIHVGKFRMQSLGIAERKSRLFRDSSSSLRDSRFYLQRSDPPMSPPIYQLSH